VVTHAAAAPAAAAPAAAAHPAAAAPSAAGVPDARERFMVKKWSAVTLWTFDPKNGAVEHCANCRNHLMDSALSARPTRRRS
jgi:hypothetical protein